VTFPGKGFACSKGFLANASWRSIAIAGQAFPMVSEPGGTVSATAISADRVGAMDDFTEFYSMRKDAVLRAVLVATGDRAGSEDATAEAFTRAYARWAGVAVHPNPTAWVVRTALNCYRSWWRRLRRERVGWFGNEPAAAGQDAPGTSDLDDSVRRVVAGLPGRQREVLALRVLAELSAEETGGVLGIAPSTVNVHLHRALASLRRTLRPQTLGTDETCTAGEESR
jgi:RNA polymerase sigma-70 factor (ECF subfamily)